MSLFQAIILSIIEGITEFLPISSTGHMILAGNFLQIPPTEFLKSFEIIIQLGAIGAVVLLYAKTLIQRMSLWPKILTAFIPTAFIGFLLYKIIKQYLLGNSIITVLALGIGGICFFIIEHLMKHKEFQTQSLSEISFKQAFFIGLTQSLSIIPGVSRSAASIFGAMAIGVSRQTAVEFSFLLAIPTMMAATALDLLKNSLSFTPSEVQMLIVGFVGAFITALIAVKAFLKYIQSNTFIPFAWYRIILALLFSLYVLKR